MRHAYTVGKSEMLSTAINIICKAILTQMAKALKIPQYQKFSASTLAALDTTERSTASKLFCKCNGSLKIFGFVILLLGILTQIYCCNQSMLKPANKQPNFIQFPLTAQLSPSQQPL